MKNWIQTIAIVLALTLAVPLAAPAVYADTAEESAQGLPEQETELQEVQSAEEDEKSVNEEGNPAEAIGTEEQKEETEVPDEKNELPAQKEEFLIPEETVLPEDSEDPVKQEETEKEEETETEETEETEEMPPDEKGYAGMGYASWIEGRRMLRSKSAGDSSGGATLRNEDYVQILGIDISEMNTITDWTKIRESGVQVVIIRVGGRYYGSGTIYDDDMFETNVRNAYNMGLKIGVYFFSQAINEQEAIQEADYCAEKMTPYKSYITLPVYMDYEWSSGQGYRLEKKGGTVAQRTNTIKAFCSEIQKKGYQPGFYSFDYLMGTFVDCNEIAGVASIWIAHWGVSSPGYYYTGVFDHWQYTSDGTVQGITGRVDMDYWYLPESECPVPGIYENVEGKEGIFMLSSVASPGYVITVGSDGNLTLQESTGGNNQRFILTADSYGHYRISSFMNGKRFDCQSGGTVSGTNVRTYTGNNSLAQTWLLQSAADGTYYIVSFKSGYKIAIDSETSNIQLGTRAKTDDQAFRLSKVSSDTVSEGWYNIKCAASSSYVLDIASGSFANGANVQIYKSNGTVAQKIYIQKMNDGFYRLMVAKTGKMIDVKGTGKGDNVNIHQYEANDSDTQRWIVLKNDDGTYSFFSKSGNRALSVASSNFANKSNILQWTYNCSKGQKFTLTKKAAASGATVAEGRYYIVSSKNKSYVINVAGASLANAANIQINTKQDNQWQQFILSYLGNGYYTIYNNHSGRVLDVKGGSTANKANIQQYQANGTPAQNWKIRRNSDGTFTMVNQKTGKVIDIVNGTVAQNSNIQQYNSNGTAAQKFIFQKP